MQFLNGHKITVVKGAQADGTGTISSDILDMSGYEGVVFLALFDDVDNGATLALTAQQNAVNGTSGMATLAGSSVSVTADATSADDKCMVLDVYKPLERYVRCQLVIGAANATLSKLVAIQYGAHLTPVSQHASVIDSDSIVSPSEA